MKRVLIFGCNSKDIEKQLKTIESIFITIIISDFQIKEIFENKPNLIIINQNSVKDNLRESLRAIFTSPNAKSVILMTENGPEKQTFEVWSSPAHIVKLGDLDQLRLTVKEVLDFY